MTEETKERLVVDPLAGYELDIGRLLWMLEDGRRLTKELLTDLPHKALGWQPAPGENSIATLLYHIAAVEADWLYVEVLQQPTFPSEMAALFPRDMRDDHGRLAVPDDARLLAHVMRLDAVRRALLEAFRGMSLDDFRRERNMPEYDVTPEWVLHHLIQHEAEHRGEIGLIRAFADAG